MKLALSVAIINKETLDEIVEHPDTAHIEPFIVCVFGMRYLLKVCDGSKTLQLMIERKDDNHKDE